MSASFEDVFAIDLFSAESCGDEQGFREECDSCSKDERDLVLGAFFLEQLDEVVTGRDGVCLWSCECFFVVLVFGLVVVDQAVAAEGDRSLFADDSHVIDESAWYVGEDDQASADIVCQFDMEHSVCFHVKFSGVVVIVDESFGCDREFPKHPQDNVLVVRTRVVDLAAAGEFRHSSPVWSAPILRHIDKEVGDFSDHSLLDHFTRLDVLEFIVALVVDDSDLLLLVAEPGDFQGVFCSADHRLFDDDVLSFLESVLDMVVVRDVGGEDADCIEVVFIDEFFVVFRSCVSDEVIISDDLGQIVESWGIDIDSCYDLESEFMSCELANAVCACATTTDGTKTNRGGISHFALYS